MGTQELTVGHETQKTFVMSRCVNPVLRRSARPKWAESWAVARVPPVSVHSHSLVDPSRP
jgi:hypothetical protein